MQYRDGNVDRFERWVWAIALGLGLALGALMVLVAGIHHAAPPL
jgi:hypothetical protein